MEARWGERLSSNTITIISQFSHSSLTVLSQFLDCFSTSRSTIPHHHLPLYRIKTSDLYSGVFGYTVLYGKIPRPLQRGICMYTVLVTCHIPQWWSKQSLCWYSFCHLCQFAQWLCILSSHQFECVDFVVPPVLMYFTQWSATWITR